VQSLRLREDIRPLYVQAGEAIRSYIVSSQLEPGDRLPAEVELARLLGVSRPTIREALRHLQLLGLVRRLQGTGTVVEGGSTIVAGLETLENMEALARRQGWSCGTSDVRVTIGQLNAEEAVDLGRDEDCETVGVTRVKTKDEVPVAFMESKVPTDVLSEEAIKANFADSIIEMFLKLGRPDLHYARASVQLCSASEELVERLHMPLSSPLLLLREIFYTRENQPFCLNRNWFVPGSLALQFIRRPW
jgi:GntR family transcriptional regulator